MAMVHEVPRRQNRLAAALTTDFCPWANRFLYWLKEPVGWLVLATAVNVLIGLHLAPIGWVMAAALVAVIAVGMIWPAVAVYSVRCQLRPGVQHVHEGERCPLVFSVRNRLPLPIWGLAVEGYLDREQPAEQLAEQGKNTGVPSVALAFVRGLSVCDYQFEIAPALRGRYPKTATSLTCSFPFGIWTARRQLADTQPVTVWPRVHPIADRADLTGRRRTDTGTGDRPGPSGDFLGVREYRSGDPMRSVNWVATARADRLIVTERGGPQCSVVDVQLDTRVGTIGVVADRVRVAASVVASLHGAGTPMRLRLGGRTIAPRIGRDGFVKMMNSLADVPATGEPGGSDGPRPPHGAASVTISSNAAGDPVVCVVDPSDHHRFNSTHRHRVIDRQRDIGSQLQSLWASENSHAAA